LNIKQGEKTNAYPGGQPDYIDERKYLMAQEIAEGSFKIMFKHLAVVYDKKTLLRERNPTNPYIFQKRQYHYASHDMGFCYREYLRSFSRRRYIV